MAEHPIKHQASALRRVRSFVRRAGRETQGQRRAHDQWWPRYGLATTGQLLDFSNIFASAKPVVLEIGFGMGDSLASMAEHNIQTNYLGLEVYQAGVSNLLKLLAEKNLTNVKIIAADAVDVLSNNIADASLSGLQLYFPDPWPKKKHHKRRIVQPEFINLVGSKLKSGGYLHMATDWQPYAEHMLSVMRDSLAFSNGCSSDFATDRPFNRPVTKFERRGAKLGHGVWDLLWYRR